MLATDSATPLVAGTGGSGDGRDCKKKGTEVDGIVRDQMARR
jgi:hypothetical protein